MLRRSALLIPAILLLTCAREICCNSDRSLFALLDRIFGTLLADETDRAHSFLLLDLLNTTVNSTTAPADDVTDAAMARGLLPPSFNALSRPFLDNTTMQRINNTAVENLSKLFTVAFEDTRTIDDCHNASSAVALAAFGAIIDTHTRLLVKRALLDDAGDQQELELTVIDILRTVVMAVTGVEAESDLVAIAVHGLASTFTDAFDSAPSIEALMAQDFFSVLHVVFKMSLAPGDKHFLGEIAVRALLEKWRLFIMSHSVTKPEEAVRALFRPVVNAIADARSHLSSPAGLAAFLLPSALEDVTTWQHGADTFIGHLPTLLLPSCPFVDGTTSGGTRMAIRALFDSLEALLLDATAAQHLSVVLNIAVLSFFHEEKSCRNCDFIIMAVSLLHEYIMPAEFDGRRRLISHSINSAQAAQLLEGVLLDNVTSPATNSSLDSLAGGLGPLLLSQNDSADTVFILLNKTLTEILKSEEPGTDAHTLASELHGALQELEPLSNEPDKSGEAAHLTNILLSHYGLEALLNGNIVDYAVLLKALEAALKAFRAGVKWLTKSEELYGLKITTEGVLTFFIFFGILCGALAFSTHRILAWMVAKKALPSLITRCIDLHYPLYTAGVQQRPNRSDDDATQDDRTVIRRCFRRAFQLLQVSRSCDTVQERSRYVVPPAVCFTDMCLLVCHCFRHRLACRCCRRDSQERLKFTNYRYVFLDLCGTRTKSRWTSILLFIIFLWSLFDIWRHNLLTSQLTRHVDASFHRSVDFAMLIFFSVIFSVALLMNISNNIYTPRIFYVLTLGMIYLFFFQVDVSAFLRPFAVGDIELAPFYSLAYVMLASTTLFMGGVYVVLVLLTALFNPTMAWFFANMEVSCRNYVRRRIRGVPTGQEGAALPPPPIPMHTPTFFLLVVAFSLSWTIRTAIHQGIFISSKYMLVSDQLETVDLGHDDKEKAKRLAETLFRGLYPDADKIFNLDDIAEWALQYASRLVDFVDFMTVMLYISISVGVGASGLVLWRILQGYRRTMLRLIKGTLAIRTQEMQQLYRRRHPAAVPAGVPEREVKVVSHLLVGTKLLGITFVVVTMAFYISEFIVAFLSLIAITLYFAQKLILAAMVEYRNYVLGLITLYFIQLVLVAALFKRVVSPSGAHVSRPAWFHAFVDLMVLVNLPLGIVLGVTRVVTVAVSGMLFCFSFDKTPIIAAALDSAHQAFLAACTLCYEEFNPTYRCALTCINDTVHDATMTVPSTDASRSRHVRVRNRLWLAVTLHNNPCLISMRKQGARDKGGALDKGGSVMVRVWRRLSVSRRRADQPGTEGSTLGYMVEETDGDGDREEKTEKIDMEANALAHENSHEMRQPSGIEMGDGERASARNDIEASSEEGDTLLLRHDDGDECARVDEEVANKPRASATAVNAFYGTHQVDGVDQALRLKPIDSGLTRRSSIPAQAPVDAPHITDGPVSPSGGIKTGAADAYASHAGPLCGCCNTLDVA
ncbi:unnamed protein product [Vitrella brassicaformis CCMP3155]|uniref:Ion transport domain-containing protein n=2 Tax=Vitrella brassicaformis TaxID=1169539 RepID=A0A0G4FFB3_VITBC|nr:unnamed protein product [Vitrella brassicaformis CCMP3155]|eukprot:CEM11549.1 unnamed protein product [Vitrella brassicaformis CCMP3155]